MCGRAARVLSDHRSSVESLFVLGGEAAVSASLVEALTQAIT